jgi:hypothetical protein
MTVEFWIGKNFETTHERQASKKILELLEKEFGGRKELLFLCVNHYLNGNQVDFTILKHDAVIVVELKEYDKPFHATENGSWKNKNDQSIIGSDEENPFEQVSRYRRLWMDYLNKNSSKFLSDQKKESMSNTHVSAFVVISPNIHKDTTNDLPGRIKPWFQLCGLDELPSKVNFQTSNNLNFSNEELRKLVRDVMNLRPGDINTGLMSDRNPTSRNILIPPLPAMLIGREQAIEDLKIRLGVVNNNGTSNYTNTQILTAIRGWPGVGKTTLAAALAHDQTIAKEFPDGILWTSLGQNADIFTELQKWARSLEIGNIEDLKTPGELREQIIADLKDKRILLIIDDVWSIPDGVFFQVGGRRSATLVTTRIPLVAEKLAPTENDIYLLPVLSSDDSILLLKEISPIIVKDYYNECKMLANELEGLPLALQVASKMLSAEYRRGGSINELVTKILEEGELIKQQAPADRSDLVKQTTPTIAALLEISINILDTETKDRFAFLGAFAPKPATFDLEDLKDIWNTNNPESTIYILSDQGLIENINGRYQMHALLVMLAKSLLT